jgi:hypothetical protein
VLPLLHGEFAVQQLKLPRSHGASGKEASFPEVW